MQISLLTACHDHPWILRESELTCIIEAVRVSERCAGMTLLVIRERSTVEREMGVKATRTRCGKFKHVGSVKIEHDMT